MDRPALNPQWLENSLARSLGPARAPEELWDRIDRPRTVQSPHARRPLVWALAGAPVAALALLVAGWGLHATLRPPARDLKPQAWVKMRIVRAACGLCHGGADPLIALN